MRALMAATLLGCGGDRLPAVGAPCTDQSQCEARSTAACIATWPEGYCTELSCSIGSCGDGAVCAAGLMFPEVPFTQFCLSTCSVLADCRAGYACVDISQAQKVCLPENAQ